MNSPGITTLEGLTDLINSLSASATSLNAALYSDSLETELTRVR